MILIVVIPFYHEEKPLIPMESLFKAQIGSIIDVVCVFNAKENDSAVIEVNKKAIELLNKNKLKYSSKLNIHILVEHTFTEKKNGVGLARRIGMDYAENLYDQEVLLFSFDADSEVSPAYFTTVLSRFKEDLSLDLLCLNYEHRIDLCRSEEERNAIIHYELYLRTYTNAWKLANYPYALTTIGSSFVVKGSSYVRYGRMNKKKAGEDFYFIHKIAQNGKVSTENSVLVFPSPRLSHRVPFGTGHFITNFVGESIKEYTYPNLSVFLEMKSIFSQLLKAQSEDQLKSIFVDLPQNISNYLMQNEFNKSLEEAILHTSNIPQAALRITKWFTGLRMIQYLHYAENQTKKNSLINLSMDLGIQLGLCSDLKAQIPKDKYEVLKNYREFDSH